MKMQVVVYKSGNRVVHYDNIVEIYDLGLVLALTDENKYTMYCTKSVIEKIEITLENLE